MDFIDTTEKKFVLKNCRRIYRQSIKRQSPPFLRKNTTQLRYNEKYDLLIGKKHDLR